MLSSNDTTLTQRERTILLEIAAASIDHGLSTGQPLKIRSDELPGRLAEPRATFVTLRIDGQLRGCMGRLIATSPLAVDIAENAFSAAFRDPRFNRLGPDEAHLLDIHISILSPPERIPCSDESELLRMIRPGIDGLILKCGPMRGTLLPSVWKSVSSPDRFLRHLKLKAGLPEDFWSSDIHVYRYTTESFSSDDIETAAEGRVPA
ncbi:MAG: AmmeMemoRadiSam system protein A [Planctomycetaceae bacterium]